MTTSALGKSDIAINTDVLLYTVPLLMYATVNIRIVNRTAAAIPVRVAIGTGASPTDADYVLYDFSVPATGMTESTGVALSVGEKVWVRSAAVGLTARLAGFEELL